MIIKQKSLIVALVSGFVVSTVLVLTLVAYLAYIELKGEEFKRSYQELLHKANAKVYSKYIEVSKLKALLEREGALKGKPIIEGIVKNNGAKHITGILINVKFLDRDGAVIYEEAFYPHEPSLGEASLPRVSIPYLYSPTKVILRPDECIPFKRILRDCPKEIADLLQERAGFGKTPGRWSGRLVYEVISIAF